MGHAIPRRHPAVVLRSQFNKLRALLAIALVAVVGLTVAVAMLANDNEVTSTTGADPIESIDHGDSHYINPSTGYPSTIVRPGSSSRYEGGPVSRYEADGKSFIVRPGSASRYEGGPVSRYEADGKYFIVRPGSSTPRDGGAPEATRSPASEAKHEAATAAAIGQSSDGTVTGGSKTDPHSPASLLP
jgi:hypothetical protein